MTDMTSPLEGITILDLTRVLSGPYCTMLLADMGARVIKIEQPGKGDDTRAWGPPFLEGEAAYFLSINRNKESVTLDFKRPEGRAILERLIDRSDVLVENFRPGTLAKMGLDYAGLRDGHRRLVYCSISGFGQTGPRANEPGYDAVMQGEGGLMSITGATDGPPFRLGVAITDIVSGMLAAQGIVLALYARERTGRGQLVDLAMLDAATALLTYQAAAFFASGRVPTRLGNRHPSIVPYETFTAADGDFVLAVGNDEIWKRFCAAAEIEANPRYATNRERVLGYDSLRPIIAARLGEHPRAHWIARLRAAGVPCGAVRNVQEVFDDPQIHAREMITEVPHDSIGTLRVLGVPIKLSDTPGSVRSAPPRLGQHTSAVLEQDAGLSRQEIERLAGLKIV